MEWLAIALLGGIMGLDVVCFPQMMYSRPLVAATIAGAVLGHAGSGAMVGVTMELIAIATLPFGASRYPEWGSAAVVAGALAATLPPERAGFLTVSAAVGLTTAWVGGLTLIKLRQFNAWMARRRRPQLDAGSRRAVIELQLAGLTGDFVRAVLVTVGMYALLAPIAHAAVGSWSSGDQLSRSVVVSLACAVAGSAAWTIFHSARGTRWYFAGGLLVGLAILVLA